MSFELAIAGWTFATAALVLAALLRRELDRRARLVARACHEVRGPLGAARLGLHLLSRPGVPPPPSEALELELERAGRALEDLDAAIRGRRASDRIRRLDLSVLARSVVATRAPVAAGHGTRMEFGPLEPGAWVEGDPVRLAQACANLLANAAEHGAGPVRVSVRRRRARVLLAVEDGGPGLPASVAALVREEGSRPRGHGLGVVADVAERHGGRLAAAPSSRGARLVLELPAAGR